jgi:dihydrodipicolinate synthase/N-acetylneuraminate lyase
MKTTPVTPADLARSVIAVPPLARHADYSLNTDANQALIASMEAGGIRSLMYGGNANFYHLPLADYASTVDFLADAAGADTWLLPSVGPDYGKMMDQAAVLKTRAFPAAMLLPMAFPYTDEGLGIGVRRFTDALGKPAVLYLKTNNYIAPATLAALIEEGRIAAVKYAVVLDDPLNDPYLRALLAAVDSQYIVSGIGERPAIIHMRDFGLRSFTTGSGVVGPRGSMALLALLKAGDYAAAAEMRERYIPLEDQRDGISPIRVLHEAVTLSGIADMGPLLPLLTGLTESQRQTLAPIAQHLLALDQALATAQA